MQNGRHGLSVIRKFKCLRYDMHCNEAMHLKLNTIAQMLSRYTNAFCQYRDCHNKDKPLSYRFPSMIKIPEPEETVFMLKHGSESRMVAIPR